MTDPRVAQERQSLLLGALACPVCGGPLTLAAAARHQGLVVDADLSCPLHGAVGVVESYAVSFRPPDVERARAHRVPAGRVRVPVGIDDDGLELVGRWESGWEGLRTGPGGSHRAVLPFRGVGISITFFAHSWSGRAELWVDDELVQEVDLFRVETEFVVVDLVGFPNGGHRLEVVPTGERHPAAGGDQIVLNRFDVLRRPVDAPLPQVDPVNRGNGFPPRFEELVDLLPEGGIAVDLGGGDRRFGDPRVFNLEYMRFELPDLFADGLRLPFRSGSLDLVLSQAVLEHVPDPQQAVDEMRRVLKPGGVLYCEVAFMQPLHAVPSHYFNVTIFGLEYLLRDWDLRESGTFTGLHDTFEWMGRCVSAEEKIGRERLQLALEVLAEIDEKTPSEELRPIAGSVYAEASAPVSSMPDPPAAPAPGVSGIRAVTGRIRRILGRIRHRTQSLLGR
ncbi:MAG: methyltransferase domain-containing protein [Actinobacteria bacterium]|nr:methyltransferase domain-containing protein [Actinomycetota bacterium]